MPPSEKQTLLKTKIEQLLTEARVIIPGAQALLGFQFVVVFVRSFAELPGWVHAVALAAIALSVVLLMTQQRFTGSPMTAKTVPCSSGSARRWLSERLSRSPSVSPPTFAWLGSR
jgi:hypothetical protein